MARCNDKTDEQYRKIVGVLRQFMRKQIRDGDKTMFQALPSTVTGAETRKTAVTTKLNDQSIS
jgi:hypothetical protein